MLTTKKKTPWGEMLLWFCFAVFAGWLMSGCTASLPRQCRMPILVAAHASLTPLEVAAVADATEYWNAELETRVFLFSGVIDDDDDQPKAEQTDGMRYQQGIGRGVLLVGRPANFTVEAQDMAAAMLVPADDDVCTYSNWIEVYWPKGDRLTKDYVVSIFRHEFGHILGLSHSRNREDLMWGRVNGWPPPGGQRATARDLARARQLLPAAAPAPAP